MHIRFLANVNNSFSNPFLLIDGIKFYTIVNIVRAIMISYTFEVGDQFSLKWLCQFQAFRFILETNAKTPNFNSTKVIMCVYIHFFLKKSVALSVAYTITMRKKEYFFLSKKVIKFNYFKRSYLKMHFSRNSFFRISANAKLKINNRSCSIFKMFKIILAHVVQIIICQFNWCVFFLRYFWFFIMSIEKMRDTIFSNIWRKNRVWDSEKFIFFSKRIKIRNQFQQNIDSNKID